MAQKVFEGCRNLTDITFAENSKLESISAYMFDGCTNLQTITFEQGRNELVIDDALLANVVTDNKEIPSGRISKV